jgi:hypothetical protein
VLANTPQSSNGPHVPTLWWREEGKKEANSTHFERYIQR